MKIATLFFMSQVFFGVSGSSGIGFDSPGFVAGAEPTLHLTEQFTLDLAGSWESAGKTDLGGYSLSGGAQGRYWTGQFAPSAGFRVGHTSNSEYTKTGLFGRFGVAVGRPYQYIEFLYLTPTTSEPHASGFGVAYRDKRRRLGWGADLSTIFFNGESGFRAAGLFFYRIGPAPEQ